MLTYEPHVVQVGVAAATSLMASLVVWYLFVEEGGDALLMVAARMFVIELVCLGCGRDLDKLTAADRVKGAKILDAIFTLGVMWLFLSLCAEIEYLDSSTGGKKVARDLAVSTCLCFIATLLVQSAGLPRWFAVNCGAALTAAMVLYLISQKH